MLSKELLSAVLGVNVRYFGTNIKKINYSINVNIEERNIAYFNSKWKYINIYELAYLCKEWAYKHKGLICSKHCVTSDDLTQHTYSFEATGVLYRGHPSKTLVKNFIEDTEPEAIFKATSYIMEQLKELEE